MIKGVIFDMDGVIIDSEPMHRKIFEDYAKDTLHIEVTDAEYDTFIGSTNTHIFSLLKERFHLNQEVGDLIAEYDRKIEEFLLAAKASIAPIAGVYELADQLHKDNMKLAVASSSAQGRIDLVIDMFGMDSFFTTKISGQQVKHSKPAPDIFLLAAKTLGLSPTECVVIEDSKNGVAAAKAAGMKCIGYNNPNSGNQDISRADRIIKRFFELIPAELRKM